VRAVESFESVPLSAFRICFGFRASNFGFLQRGWHNCGYRLNKGHQTMLNLIRHLSPLAAALLLVALPGSRLTGDGAGARGRSYRRKMLSHVKSPPDAPAEPSPRDGEFHRVPLPFRPRQGRRPICCRGRTDRECDLAEVGKEAVLDELAVRAATFCRRVGWRLTCGQHLRAIGTPSRPCAVGRSIGCPQRNRAAKRRRERREMTDQVQHGLMSLIQPVSTVVPPA